MFGLSIGDLRRLKDFVSPSFFEVLPPRTLWNEGRRLLASRRDREGFARVIAQLQQVATGEPVGVTFVDSLDIPDAGDPTRRGEALLRLCFAQLAHLSVAALDLRHDHFRWDGRRLNWKPQPLFTTWSPTFSRGVRDLYSGFYRGDETLFESAAVRLRLTPAVDLFVEHFGGGDQRSVTFDQSSFKDSFHAIFVRCRDAGTVLDPGFIGLGVMLSALYEHLSTLGVPLDVRGAFEAVWPS